jgi:hypothetical protein
MLEGKLYDVEHALGMHATRFVIIPASAIYEDDLLADFAEQITASHVYLIGHMPEFQLVDSRAENDQVVICSYDVAGVIHELRWAVPAGCTIGHTDGLCHAVDSDGVPVFASHEKAIRRLNDEQGIPGFHVLYVGQAYGDDGSRSAVDRLRRHETLQKIALQGAPVGHELYLILLEVEPQNTVFTVFCPEAQNKDEGGERISMGLDKLFNTNEAERTALYEASLIRYFQPKYNKEFKNSFPSTNLKVLADCYAKDFSAVVAELCNERFPCEIFSERVAPSRFHIVTHDLHAEAARKLFFF